jgi:hypothetical protein
MRLLLRHRRENLPAVTERSVTRRGGDDRECSLVSWPTIRIVRWHPGHGKFLMVGRIARLKPLHESSLLKGGSTDVSLSHQRLRSEPKLVMTGQYHERDTVPNRDRRWRKRHKPPARADPNAPGPWRLRSRGNGGAVGARVPQSQFHARPEVPRHD